MYFINNSFMASFVIVVIHGYNFYRKKSRCVEAATKDNILSLYPSVHVFPVAVSSRRPSPSFSILFRYS